MTFSCQTLIIDQYDIPRGQTAVKGNELGIFEALAQHYSKEDLDAYFAKIEPYVDPKSCFTPLPFLTLQAPSPKALTPRHVLLTAPLLTWAWPTPAGRQSSTSRPPFR